jgi:diaminohydroxyphosphoribosylaminopyrimidine deaminase/5-amino-6-(5-phosphoribosylamino)uracil reductase
VNDDEALQLAFALAEIAEGDTSPNPLVGAVVVRDGEIVGRGYHRRFGGPHAEVFALEEAGERARGATLYVTLEPCAHHGKTPPCTDRLIEAGIARAVVPIEDPNRLVSGRGIAALRAVGIDVEVGRLREVAERQNEIFFTYMRTGLPFVHLKLAVSLDGRLATRTGDARWITSEPSRILAHRLRRRHATVLVGLGTVLADDPALTVRHVVGRQPVPVVLDAGGGIPLTARLIEGGRRPIVAVAQIPAERRAELESAGCRVWELPGDGAGRVDLAQLLARLGEAGIDSVLVVGGGDTAASFLEAGLVDRVSFFIAPLVIGGRAAVPAVGGVGAARLVDAVRLSDVTTAWIGPDLLYSARVQRSKVPRT